MYKRFLIVADIEGSTGCSSYEASSFNTSLWYDACIEMSLDIDAVVRRLFNNGAEKIYVKDFHRTGYNLLPELVDKRAHIIHGYKRGPVPGIGSVYDAEAVMFIGMHASSGSGAFLAHTLTSKYGGIFVNGRRVSELQLFASSLFRYSLKPIFFSGCDTACSEVLEDIPGINVFPVIKDDSGFIEKEKCREVLAGAAAASAGNTLALPFLMYPPFNVELLMRDGEARAKKISRRWRLRFIGDRIFFTATDFNGFYDTLIRLTYFTPAAAIFAAPALCLFNLYGRAGLSIVRFKRRSEVKKLLKVNSLSSD
jgi:D-amino peptidase